MKIIVVLLSFVFISQLIGNCTLELIIPDTIDKLNINNDWFFYPGCLDYSPKGMPDFDQKQNNWKDPVYNGWSFCGAVSVSNIFWYIDSFYSQFSGSPGDGLDVFPMVLNYYASGEPNPGPFTDDHNGNNVNDLASSWDQMKSQFGNELVERVAWYVDTNGCRTGDDIWGTNLNRMYLGVSKWLNDVRLSQYFHVEITLPPQRNTEYPSGSIPSSESMNMFNISQGQLFDQSDISNIEKTSAISRELTFHKLTSKITNGSMVVLGINAYDGDKNLYLSHWVTVAGVSDSQLQIALSDPYFDVNNRTNDFTLHNDAAFVSHDIFVVNTTSPFPDEADYFWLENYFPNTYSVITAALIITPLVDTIPQVPPLSFFIKPDEGYLYFHEKPIASTFLRNTIILGDIKFEVNAFSKEGIERIEFYLNDKLQHIDDEFPYEYFWDENSFGRYRLKIISIDTIGNYSEKQMIIWKFC